MGSIVHQYRRARASEQIERVNLPAGLVPAVLVRAREAKAAMQRASKASARGRLMPQIAASADPHTEQSAFSEELAFPA